jgi:hypothetical protein
MEKIFGGERILNLGGGRMAYTIKAVNENLDLEYADVDVGFDDGSVVTFRVSNRTELTDKIYRHQQFISDLAGLKELIETEEVTNLVEAKMS